VCLPCLARGVADVDLALDLARESRQVEAVQVTLVLDVAAQVDIENKD